MLKKLERMLPHAAILICNMYIVFFLIDRVNQAMNFIDNGLTKGLLLILCAISLYDAWRLLKPMPVQRRAAAPHRRYDVDSVPRERTGSYASKSRDFGERNYRSTGYDAESVRRSNYRGDGYSAGASRSVEYRARDTRSSDYRSYGRSSQDGYGRGESRSSYSTARRSAASHGARDRFDDTWDGYEDRRVYSREGERR